MPTPVSRDNAAELLPRYYSRPGQLNQEYSVDAVLALATVPAEVIRQQQSQVPQVLFPKRYGYRQTPLTIGDVLNTDAFAPKRRQWVSGARGMPEPAVRNPVTSAEATARPAFTANPSVGGSSSGVSW
jgi:hypothetical protein